MANTVLNASIIAKEATMILENELGMAKNVYRGYEKEFDQRVNATRPAQPSPSRSRLTSLSAMALRHPFRMSPKAAPRSP
jgi:hypothetical protein